MKRILFPNLSILCFILLSVVACQKDNIEAPAFEKPVLTETQTLYPITDIMTVDDGAKIRPSTGLPVRGGLPDIEDVPVVVVGSTINCHGTPDQCLEFYLQNLRAINAIKPGQRLGVFDALNLNRASDRNKYNCYRLYSDVGVADFCGYIGKDKDHPLNLDNNGNYRVQLTPKNTNRNLDLFVYKHTIRNGKIDTTLVAYSVLPAGKTETIHLTEKGHYTLVVDEKTTNSDGSDYIISVSNDTPVKMIPILGADNNVTYQFKNTVTNRVLIAWSFSKKIAGNWTNVGTYPYNFTFKFSCATCDYLISPVYFNTQTGLTEEGDATLFRP